MEAKFMKSITEKKKSQQAELHISSVAGTLFGVCLVIAVAGALLGDGRFNDAILGTWVVFWTVLGTYFMYALKVASQWEKAVVLRLGKFHALRGPGVFWIIPIIDSIPSWIDHRVMVTPFACRCGRRTFLGCVGC
jgi:hypothetical protein